MTSTDQVAPSSVPSVGPRPLPRRRFISDMPDRGLFCVVAVVGFGAILSGKRIGIDGDHMAGLAVAAMILYGAVAFTMPRVQLRLDRLGDNFYYLGFIYTLASLSASLIELRGEVDTKSLLGNFGLALSTTIIGVAGRVLFVQLRGDIDEIEEEVRRDLVRTSDELRATLATSLRDFETFRTGVLQSAREATEANVTRVTEQLASLDSTLRELGGKASSGLQVSSEQSKALSGSITALKEQLDVVLKKPEQRLLDDLSVAVGELKAINATLLDRLPPTRQKRRLWSFFRRSR